METAFALVMTTCGDRADGETIARLLVDKRLAACVQLFPIESFYEWEGATQNARELMVFCKIKRSDYAAVEAAILAAHPYANPEIIEIPIEKGAPAYLAWIAASTR